MNKRRIIMMLSVLFVTVLVASGFYILTGEANSGGIRVTSSTTVSGDWEKVYGDANAPYGSKTKPYYIRYTGAESGRTVVDLDEAGYGLTIKNGYPYIFNQKITNTYKMFSDNNSITRVFVPSSIAIISNGISTNTFDGDSQEIDLIYHTGSLSDSEKSLGTGLKSNSKYDKTGIVTQSNVFTYVYLGDENFSRIKNHMEIHEQFITDYYQYGYGGEIKNVYVSKEVVSLDCLFRTIIDDNYPNFPVSTEINKVLVDEDGTWTQVDCMFEGQLNLDLSSRFNLPSKVVNYSGAFAHCINLKTLPKSFKINDNAILRSTFNSCYNLSCIIEIPETTKNVQTIFYQAGIDSNENINNTGCPIVMKYSVNNIPSLVYRYNVYGLESGGKVYKQLYDWEAIQSSYGTYEDKSSGIKYYLHYRGNSSTVDLGASDKNNMLTYDNTSGKTKIFGTEVTNTYMMFSNSNSITRVFVPASIAIKSDGTDGIYKNTFNGDSQEIDLIYHTGSLSDSEKSLGTGLKSNSKYDKTGIVTQSNVFTYVYLGNENFSRIKNHVEKHEQFITDYYLYGYGGEIKNVYVSKEVVSLDCLFRTIGDDDNPNFSVSSEINKVLVDEEGTWTQADCMFEGQLNLDLSPKFNLPSKVVNYSGMFSSCENLKELPKSFKINDNAILRSTFIRCYNLSGIIEIPETTKFMLWTFSYAGRDSNEKTDGTDAPIVMKYSVKNIPSLAYRANIYGLESDGKVYKQLYDWEVIEDSANGPYVDNASGMKYYLHYRGNSSTVDLGVSDKNNMLTYDNTSGKTKIFGIDVTNTYMMFSNNNTITRVFVPANIAIKSDGIASNTFVNSKQSVIDLIYHTGEIKNKVRGEGIDSSYDKTTKIDKSKSPNVNTYVYLGNENLSRVINKNVSNVIYKDDEYFGTDYFMYGYIGKVLNAYVSKEVVSLDCLFRSSADLNDNHVGVEMNKVIVDEEGTWTQAMSMLEGSKNLEELPSNFKLPKTVKNYWGLFCDCTKLKSLPKSFEFNNNSYLYATFRNCYSLSGTINLPATTQELTGGRSFANAGTQATNKITYGGKQYSIIVKCGSQSIYNAITEVDGVLHKVLDTSIQSLNDSSQPVVIDDEVNDAVDSVQNNTDNIVIEDETDWITVTVKKSVDDVVDETQESSQSTESVSSENKENEEETQE